jgi:hypothetical protein
MAVVNSNSIALPIIFFMLFFGGSDYLFAEGLIALFK